MKNHGKDKFFLPSIHCHKPIAFRAKLIRYNFYDKCVDFS